MPRATLEPQDGDLDDEILRLIEHKGGSLDSDLVKEMMRPMLKQWLEENLPGLVERMVRAEIERVSRGGR